MRYFRADEVEADAMHAVRVHVRTVLKRCWEERGCRRFEVALILSRQGGDCTLVVSFFAFHGLVCLDRPGVVHLSVGMFCLVLAAQREEESSPSDPPFDRY